MTNSVTPFTKYDIVKVCITNEDGAVEGGVRHFYRMKQTIVDVDSSGNATMSAPATGNASGQRIHWGFDSTSAINSALATLAADPSGVHEAYLPGRYRATQIQVPIGMTLRGAGWGWYDSRTATAPYTGTSIMQLPGAETDLVTFTGAAYGSHSWLGPIGLSHMLLQGPEVGVRNVARTTGSGLCLRYPDGVHSGAYNTGQDGIEFRFLHVNYFPGHGFDFPRGAVPLTLETCRAVYNGGYGFRYSNWTGNTQCIHLQNCTVDANILGGAWFYGIPNHGSVTLTSFKSEAVSASMWETSQFIDLVPGYTPGSTDAGMNAVIFEECDGTPVTINGLDHIFAYGTKGLKPAILVKSTTTKRPRLVYNGVSVRITGTEVGSTADAVSFRDETTSTDLTAPAGHWPPSTRNITTSDDQFVIVDSADNTKKVKFELSGISSGTTKTINVSMGLFVFDNQDGTIATF